MFNLPKDVSAAVDAVSEPSPGSAPLRLHAVLRLPADVRAVGRGALGVVPEAALDRGLELLLGREPRAGGLREGVDVGPVSARLCWPKNVAHICGARAKAASADGGAVCRQACRYIGQAGRRGKPQHAGRATRQACPTLGRAPFLSTMCDKRQIGRNQNYHQHMHPARRARQAC